MRSSNLAARVLSPVAMMLSAKNNFLFCFSAGFDLEHQK